MQYSNLIESFDPLVQKNKTKPVKPKKHILPKPPLTPHSPSTPPVELPSHVPKDDWKPWWRKNKYYYGDRDYYLNLHYPVWWVDYYYPIDDIYWNVPQNFPVKNDQPNVVYVNNPNQPIINIQHLIVCLIFFFFFFLIYMLFQMRQN